MATHTADAVTAVAEHALAAGEFATAARDTASTEALRTLRLLEQHHQRLSQLLRYSLEHPLPGQQKADDGASINEKDGSQGAGTGSEAKPAGGTGAATAAATGTGKTTTSVSGVVSHGEFTGGVDGAGGAGAAADRPLKSGGSASAAAASMSAAAAAHQAGAAAMASLQQNRRHPASRELSSSIATNLASARGIRGGSASRHLQRGQPAAPSVSSDQAPGSLGGASVRGKAGSGGPQAQMQSVLQQQQGASATGKPSWVPPTPQQRPQPQTQGDMFVGTDAEDSHAAATAQVADEGFARFYNRFGSIINRLSAPLAFAGLPLITEETSSTTDGTGGRDETEAADAGQTPASKASSLPSSQAAPRRSASTGRAPRSLTSMLTSVTSAASAAAAAEPDLSQIYSRAALRAIGRDSGGGSGNDSFYVVPKTGHTASYANILSFDQKEKRRQMAASIHGGGDATIPEVPEEDEEGEGAAMARALGGGGGLDEDDEDDVDFVDAKDQPAGAATATATATSGGLLRGTRMHPFGGGGGGGRGGGSKAGGGYLVEELYTENQGLKDALDKLSRRLHAFEASAQQSHMALQESMRFMRPGSPSGGGGGGGGSSASISALREAAAPLAGGDSGTSSSSDQAALARKNRDLEEELARMVQRLEASEKERAHQEKSLQRYRERWEKLRAGAKARRDAQGS